MNRAWEHARLGGTRALRIDMVGGNREMSRQNNSAEKKTSTPQRKVLSLRPLSILLFIFPSRRKGKNGVFSLSLLGVGQHLASAAAGVAAVC